MMVFGTIILIMKIDYINIIQTIEKMVTVCSENGNTFSDWEDIVDGAFYPLQKFAKLLGHDLSLEEIKQLIDKK